MNRAERRAAAAIMRENARAWPEHLEPVPSSEWPSRNGRKGDEYPTALWRSRAFLVQAHPQPPLGSALVVRLTVNRVTMQANGHWHDGISWDELMRLKREAGYGDWYAVEIYPRDRDIVRDANMRHLWCMSEPLALGWFHDANPAR